MVEIERKLTEFSEDFENINPRPLKDSEKMVLTSCRVSFDEWNFVKDKSLQFSSLLRDKIREEMAVTHGNLTTNIHTLKNKIEVLADKLHNACRFIEKKGFIEEYLKNDN